MDTEQRGFLMRFDISAINEQRRFDLQVAGTPATLSGGTTRADEAE